MVTDELKREVSVRSSLIRLKRSVRAALLIRNC